MKLTQYLLYQFRQQTNVDTGIVFGIRIRIDKFGKLFSFSKMWLASWAKHCHINMWGKPLQWPNGWCWGWASSESSEQVYISSKVWTCRGMDST